MIACHSQNTAGTYKVLLIERINKVGRNILSRGVTPRDSLGEADSERVADMSVLGTEDAEKLLVIADS